MRSNKFLILLFLLCFATISTVSAANYGDTYIDVKETTHSYYDDKSELRINGELQGYGTDDMGRPSGYSHGLEDSEVNLSINNQIYTEKTDYWGGFDFYVPLKTGKYNYTISYKGNTTYKPCNYSSSYTIPKVSSILKADTKLGTKKIIVTTKVYGFDDVFWEYQPLSSKTISVKFGNKIYYGKTNSNGIATIILPSSSGNKKLLINFSGNGIYVPKSISKTLSISSYSLVSTKKIKKTIKFFEKRNARYKKYKIVTKKYYFNGKIKTTKKYINKKVNRIKSVRFGSGSSYHTVDDYGSDGYLQVDKYSYLKEIGIYDYVDNCRYLDYFKIYYNSGKVKKVKCTHFYSKSWIFSSKGVYKIKFYFF
ncbi:hypothetical protein [Methanobacterium alcaliphilum]|uniref:hypothetical protein n=1 Tax=Methanobacterium alcaliphilum TaxID=392018 RepID=UPI00200A8485|nr:hypothetical protein [Methanobacterium alcaliphilum]MCK9150476.1 hypothetical protein [Methanobacterium alcaliphilum]